MDTKPQNNAFSDSPASHRSMAARFQAVRRQTAALAEPLSAEDCTVQSMPDASPVKWHLAHTTWFFETFVLAPHQPGYRLFEPSFRVLFNSYYHGVGERHPRPQRGLLTRPGLDQVLGYRAAVDAAMLALLDRAEPLSAELADLIELGLNHEQQHQELILTDVKHLLSCSPLRPAYQKQWPLTAIGAPARGWVAFDEGLRRIGHDGSAFCFDNEMPRHQVWLDAFEIATHPVTHGDLLEFIDDGGYRRPELWLAAGWDLVTAQRWRAPLYWEPVDDGVGWRSFTLHGAVPVDPNTPICHLSFYEADAFARWAGARLPTEAEWEVAAHGTSTAGNHLESGALHPLAPRAVQPAGELAQLFGDVWEWTRSDYSPYPGFRCASGAVGEYNGKFMSGQYVLRGGSCVTPSKHIRASYRNFFPPEARWQFSGLRLARDLR
ncbi:ergothioneine biosynthesis protein EgtB [Piscinibacter sakaiensis]|uniref:ergothioneine biosynthesis protein EgtB n=1 Tax=Piscinibacter sakaiensis TaxID=1547922 RepID=UPI003AAB942C